MKKSPSVKDMMNEKLDIGCYVAFCGKGQAREKIDVGKVREFVPDIRDNGEYLVNVEDCLSYWVIKSNPDDLLQFTRSKRELHIVQPRKCVKITKNEAYYIENGKHLKSRNGTKMNTRIRARNMIMYRKGKEFRFGEVQQITRNNLAGGLIANILDTDDGSKLSRNVKDLLKTDPESYVIFKIQNSWYK